MSPATAPDSLLRPALMAAMAAAKAGEEEEPVLPAPAGLRPFLNFRTLPARALPAARRALESDEAFRARVAESVSEEETGRPSWLFLKRPPGWEEDLAAEIRRLEKDRGQAVDKKAEREMLKRITRAESAASRAENDAAAARADADRATEALVEERRARRQVDARRDELAARLAITLDERDQALAFREETAALIESLHSEVNRLTQASAAGSGDQAEVAGVPRVAPASVDALRAASRAALSFSESLSAAAATLDHVADAGDAGVGRSAMPAGSDSDLGATVVPRPPRPVSPRARVRSAAPLPPAMFEDSREAADHLMRLRGVVVMVDGYNVSQAEWPGVAIADQRRRLVDALSGLVARTGADVRVIFDGSDEAVPVTVPSARQAVRVSFSPPGTEADDVIIAGVADIPAGRPLVVASSDRRVQEGARRGGANVISSQQLRDLMR